MRKIKIEISKVDEVIALRGSYPVLGKPAVFCSYIIDGLMIDTGPSHARKEMMEFFEQFVPEQSILTHFHEDHSGNATVMYEKYNIPVYMTQQTNKRLQSLSVPFYRRIHWGNVQERMQGEILGDWIETPHHRFQVIQTPGHSPDHICLIEEERGWVFAGDLFLGTRLHYGLRGESIQQMIHSIRTMLSFPIETIFCGHAGVVLNGRKAFEKKLHFLEWLTEETQKLAKQGKDRREISKQLLPENKMIQIFSAGELSAVNLVDSILEESKLLVN